MQKDREFSEEREEPTLTLKLRREKILIDISVIMILDKEIIDGHKGIHIYVDDDPKLNYEVMSHSRKLFNYFLLIPLLSVFPKKIGTLILTKSSKDANEVYKNIKTSHALEILYNYNRKFILTDTFLDSIFSYFWQHNIVNALAIRNRIKLVKRELIIAIKSIFEQNDRPVKIFSLASGSARAVIEVIESLKKEKILTEVKLLDLSSTALSLSRKLAYEKGVLDIITTYKDKVSNYSKYCDKWQPDIIEMVGFLDYLNQEKATNLSLNIFKSLSRNGFFITANIANNSEEKILTNLFNWEMVYRNEKELADVLLSGGFKSQKCKIIFEPTLIHGVAIAKK